MIAVSRSMQARNRWLQMANWSSWTQGWDWVIAVGPNSVSTFGDLCDPPGQTAKLPILAPGLAVHLKNRE